MNKIYYFGQDEDIKGIPEWEDGWQFRYIVEINSHKVYLEKYNSEIIEIPFSVLYALGSTTNQVSQAVINEIFGTSKV